MARSRARRPGEHPAGVETIGWTNANLSTAQYGGDTGRNNTGGGNWTIPATVPVNAGNGLTTGATIDQAFLLANNPGLTAQQLDNALIPRLARPMEETGTKDRYNAIVSLEFRPGDDLHFFLDSMYGKKENDLERIDMNWVGRNGAVIPLNMQVDRADCANGCVVTSGTFANAQEFLEYRPHIEDTEYYGMNPGMTWQLSDKLSLDVQGNYTKSEFQRESPTLLVITPASSGMTIQYANDGGIPSIVSNVDVNNPANFVWAGGRVNMQDEERETETKGGRLNLTWGDEQFAVSLGGAYDEVSREIKAFDNSQAWQNAACGGNPNVFLPGPNTQPPCQGLTAAEITPGVGGYPSYPGLGTGFSTGTTPPVVYQGSLLTNQQVQSFLRPGPGFITADWDAFAAASNYAGFHASSPEVGSSNTGANGGLVEETTTGAYLEFNGEAGLGDNSLRYNVGVRWVETEQIIGGRVSIPDPLNTPPAPAPALADGARYPNIINFATTENTYENWLPSANVALNVTDNVVLRGALSRTMTRPNPNSMLPGLSFTSPSADTGTVGNNELDPFLSDNIDLGFEYYTGAEGYFGVAAFRKGIEGFTVNGSVDCSVHGSGAVRRDVCHLDADATGSHRFARRPECSVVSFSLSR